MDFEHFLTYNPIMLALAATIFTWLTTALGASSVFFFRKHDKKILNATLGFAAGVMIAASFWSLLEPAIEMAEQAGMVGWIPAVIGFMAGGIFVSGVNRMLPFIYKGLYARNTEGGRNSWKRSFLLIFAITLHNVPEGLAVGVAFGALAFNPDPALLAGAVALAIGIGIQNIPEGAAVSVPLRREGFSRWKAFNYGQLSGIVEPIAGVAGALLVVLMTPVLPYALSFAAGAMIFVVIKELIPESHSGTETSYSTMGVMLGFSVMMGLDVALG